MKCDRPIIALKEKRQIRNKTEIQPFNKRGEIEFQNHLREGGERDTKEEHRANPNPKPKAPPFATLQSFYLSSFYRSKLFVNIFLLFFICEKFWFWIFVWAD